MQRSWLMVLFLLAVLLQCGCGKRAAQGGFRRVKDETGNSVDMRVTTALPINPAPMESKPNSGNESSVKSAVPIQTPSPELANSPSERPELLPASAIHIQPFDAELSPEQQLEQTVLRMRKIVLACAEYSLKEGRFPSNRGKLSWRVHVLPYLGRSDLYARFKLHEPWDSPANQAAAKSVPEVYQSPFDSPGTTVYQAAQLPNSMFDDGKGLSVSEFTDAWSQTIRLVMVAPEQAVAWSKPADLEVPSDHPAAVLGGEGCLIALADGDIRWLDSQTSEREVNALLTATGGETVDPAVCTQPSAAALAAWSKRKPTVAATPVEANDAAEPSAPRVQQPGHDAVVHSRKPIPDEQASSKAKALLRASFQSEIDQLKQGQAKQSKQRFAAELMKHLSQLEEDDAAQYVLLKTVRENAAEAGDFVLAHHATAELIRRFQVDDFDLRRRTVLESAESLFPQHEDQNDELCKQAEAVLKAAIAQDDFASAQELLKVFVVSTRRRTKADRNAAGARTSDKELRIQLQRLQIAEKELSEVKKEFEKVQRAKQTLELSPEDADANYVVGHYRCCLKLQWEGGLPYLAKGSNLRLKILAAEDLATSQSEGDACNLANEYWTLGEQESGLTQRGLQLRAVYWYMQSLPTLPNGLNKVNAQRRIDEAKRQFGELFVGEALKMMSAIPADA